jgi:hypothetical protein
MNTKTTRETFAIANSVAAAVLSASAVFESGGADGDEEVEYTQAELGVLAAGIAERVSRNQIENLQTLLRLAEQKFLPPLSGKEPQALEALTADSAKNGHDFGVLQSAELPKGMDYGLFLSLAGNLECYGYIQIHTSVTPNGGKRITQFTLTDAYKRKIGLPVG